MGNSNQSNAMGGASNAQQMFNTQANQLSNQFAPQYQAANTLDTNLANDVQGIYGSMTPSNINSLFNQYGGNGTVSGGINPGDISSMGALPYQGYQQLSQGLTPQFYQGFNQYMGNLNQAIGQYQNFAQTGGYSPSDISAMYAQGNAPNLGIMQNASDNAARMQALSGGNISNMAAQMAQMGKNTQQQTSANAVATAANVAQQVQAGKEYGTSGLAQSAVAGAGLQQQVQELNNQMVESGLGGMTQIEQDRLASELQNAQLNQTASNANVGYGLQRSQDVLSSMLQSASGLNSLYSAQPGATALAGNQQLNLQQLIQSGNLGAIQAYINATQIPSGFQSMLGNMSGLMNLFGGGANALSGLNTGNGGNNSSFGNTGQNPDFSPGDTPGVQATTGGPGGGTDDNTNDY